MFRIISLLIRSMREGDTDANHYQGYGDNKHAQYLPYNDDYAAPPPPPPQRQTCRGRKAERRVERQTRREERRQRKADRREEWRKRKAERREEWQQRRAERRAHGGCGGCCGKKRRERREADMLGVPMTPIPAVTSSRGNGMQSTERTDRQVGVGFEDVGAGATSGAMDSSELGSPSAHDMPPTYDEVVKGE